MISRRNFLQKTAGVAAAMGMSSTVLLSAQADDGPMKASDAIGLPKLGRLKTRTAKEIKASKLSIGFETLDRYQFEPSRTYKPLGKLGVKAARAQTGWCRCETTKGKYDFRWLDEVADGLLGEGIEPWFSLSYGNRLYTPAAPDVSAVGFCPMFTEEARAGWAGYVSAITEHFAGRVKRWEIWNEPNGGAFWRPKKADAVGYVELAKFTAPLVRRKIPDAVIVGLGLAGCDMRYFETAVKSGLTDWVDLISFHPYSAYPENDEKFVAAANKKIAEHSDKVKLCQGECGCPSDPKTEGGADPKGRKLNEELQAKWLTRRIFTDLRHDLAFTSYFTTVDLTHYNWGNGRSNHAQSYGVLRGQDYSPKPSYYAYQAICTLFDADAKLDPHAKLVPTSSGDKQIRTAVFAKNGRPLAVYWLASDLLNPFTPGKISMRLATPGLAALKNPVLIDPLSQQIYDLKGVVSSGDSLALADLPLLNHALIVADRSAVTIM